MGSGPWKWTQINQGQLGGSFGVHFQGPGPICNFIMGILKIWDNFLGPHVPILTYVFGIPAQFLNVWHQQKRWVFFFNWGPLLDPCVISEKKNKKKLCFCLCVVLFVHAFILILWSECVSVILCVWTKEWKRRCVVCEAACHPPIALFQIPKWNQLFKREECLMDPGPALGLHCAKGKGWQAQWGLRGHKTPLIP